MQVVPAPAQSSSPLSHSGRPRRSSSFCGPRMCHCARSSPHCDRDLNGGRAGQWSIRVNDQWRVCFLWHDGNAENVEIVDYH
ncbi:MAG TPA: type II toxin-antitoxin system RelE/ParE family toxin [Reyranella sp.]|nr:type II toxin-antitoxin system RelE/ParE family toxin [Reyranella sp.]